MGDHLEKIQMLLLKKREEVAEGRAVFPSSSPLSITSACAFLPWNRLIYIFSLSPFSQNVKSSFETPSLVYFLIFHTVHIGIDSRFLVCLPAPGLTSATQDLLTVALLLCHFLF